MIGGPIKIVTVTLSHTFDIIFTTFYIANCQLLIADGIAIEIGIAIAMNCRRKSILYTLLLAAILMLLLYESITQLSHCKFSLLKHISGNHLTPIATRRGWQLVQSNGHTIIILQVAPFAGAFAAIDSNKRAAASIMQIAMDQKKEAKNNLQTTTTTPTVSFLFLFCFQLRISYLTFLGAKCR